MQWDISSLLHSILFCFDHKSKSPNPCESSFSDWQLLFARPCLKAKVSSFLSRLCRARGWCKDLDWNGLGFGAGGRWSGIGPFRLSPAWQKPWADGWARLITKVTSLCGIKPPVHGQTSLHIEANWPYTKTRTLKHLQACTWIHGHEEAHVRVLRTEGKKGDPPPTTYRDPNKTTIKRNVHTSTHIHTKSPG